MIYMVECGFSDPAKEQEWSTWYSGPKLAQVLSVPGFRHSQRFRSVEPRPAPYIAVHSVDSGSLFTGSSYKGAGGGSFNEWQAYITNWRRTLFAGLEGAAEVGQDQLLLVIDDAPTRGNGMGVPIDWLQSAGLDDTVPWRGLAAISRADAARLQSRTDASVRLYEPISPLLRRVN